MQRVEHPGTYVVRIRGGPKTDRRGWGFGFELDGHGICNGIGIWGGGGRSGAFGFSSRGLPGLVSVRYYTYIVRVALICADRYRHERIAVAIALAGDHATHPPCWAHQTGALMPVLRRSEDIQAHRALGLAPLRSSSLAARPSNADDARELGGDEAVEKAVRSTMEAWIETMGSGTTFGTRERSQDPRYSLSGILQAPPRTWNHAERGLRH